MRAGFNDGYLRGPQITRINANEMASPRFFHSIQFAPILRSAAVCEAPAAVLRAFLRLGFTTAALQI